MKLCELLAVCTDSADLNVQVMIDGESIIGSAIMLADYLREGALDMNVVGIAAEDKNKLKVWVEA